MPRGDKSKYTDKQKRQAEHIEESERARGRSSKVAERIAWATVNKQDGGGKRGGSGSARRTRARRSKSPAPRSQTRASSAMAHARGRRRPRGRAH